jgi:short-subunit dehydrogenase
MVIFETNTFGVMAMTQAIVPQMRERRSGTIINVTSSVVLAPHPLVSVYAASKWAIEGFTECLAPELAAFNVRAKLVQPGYGPSTQFTANSDVRIEDAVPEAYQAFAKPSSKLSHNLVRSPRLTTLDVWSGVWPMMHQTNSAFRQVPTQSRSRRAGRSEPAEVNRRACGVLVALARPWRLDAYHPPSNRGPASCDVGFRD